jgi:hypothetical protein
VCNDIVENSEYGCAHNDWWERELVVVVPLSELEELRAAAREVVAMWDRGLYLPSDFTTPRMNALRMAFDATLGEAPQAEPLRQGGLSDAV